MNAENRKCEKCGAQFVVEAEDFDFYQRLDLPAPDYCRYCMWKYLLAFWVFGRFRITNSALSGKRIITVLPESVAFPMTKSVD